MKAFLKSFSALAALVVLSLLAPVSVADASLTPVKHDDMRSSCTPSASGKIAFSSNRDGNFEIYTMDPDGSNQTQLTHTASGYADHPAWSPDGKKIAYCSDPVGDYGKIDIYVMNADGSSQVNVSNRPDYTFCQDPAWSPNGDRIAFVRDQQICVMNADGSGVSQLTNTALGNLEPSWTSDGAQIVFSSARDGNYELYIMDADGLNQTRVTDNSVIDINPDCSPDGTQIAFRSRRNNNDDIYTIIPSQGNQESRLTDNLAFDDWPSWSPDGTQIVFQTDRDGVGNQEIYIMNADGSGQTRLTNNPAVDQSPDWGRNVLPAVDGFSPNYGGDGTIVTITGSGFTGAGEVSFGGLLSPDFTVVSDTQITAKVMYGDPGLVEVNTPVGSAVSSQKFYYYPQPAIQSAPTSARMGDNVTITANTENASACFPSDISLISVRFGTDAQGNGGVPGTVTAVGDAVNYGGLYYMSTSITVAVGNGASGYIAVETPGGTAVHDGFVFLSGGPTVGMTVLQVDKLGLVMPWSIVLSVLAAGSAHWLQTKSRLFFPRRRAKEDTE